MRCKVFCFIFFALLHGIYIFAQAESITWAWGDNEYGQLGNGPSRFSNIPVHVLNLTNVQAIAAGCKHSLSISSFDCLNDLGDVDGDGQITAYDASLVLQAIVGWVTLIPQQECVADTDRDGQMTSYDASLILQCIVGICTTLPQDFFNACQAEGHCL